MLTALILIELKIIFVALESKLLTKIESENFRLREIKKERI